MTYKKITLFLKEFDLKLSSTIFNKFISEIDKKDVRYPNFNHYYDPNKGDVIPKIRVRFEFLKEGVDRVGIKIAKKLKDESFIVDFSEWEKIDNIEDWKKFAHELTSRFSIVLIDNNDYYNLIHNKPPYFILSFMVTFTYLFFKTFADVEIQFDDQLLKPFSTGSLNSTLNEYVDKCIELSKSNIEPFKNPKFIERFIHLFFNCILVGGIPFKNIDLENHLWINMMISFKCNDYDEAREMLCKEISKNFNH